MDRLGVDAAGTRVTVGIDPESIHVF